MQPNDENRSKWPVILAVALICVGGFVFASLLRQRQQAKDLAAENQNLNASLTQVQSDLHAVTSKLNDVLAAKSGAVQAAPASPRPKAKAPVKHKTTHQTTQIHGSIVKQDDPRWNNLQNQIADQQRQIEGARQDLTNDLNKTRDDLSTSIARTHDELVVLEKRGERSFSEFQLDRSKQFQRIGSVRLSLRKADVKHKSFDLAMMVDDNELQKKKVNLYEPVWINLAGEQLELVVNRITKDQVQGYVSAPKYKKSELAGIQ